MDRWTLQPAAVDGDGAQARARRRVEEQLAVAVTKARHRSQQITDEITVAVGVELAIEPPLDPKELLQLTESNAIHGACLGAKADDAVGKGFMLEAIEAADPALSPASGEEESGRVLARLEEFLDGLSEEWSFHDLLWQAAWELEAIGWAAWEVARGGDGEVVSIYPMPAYTVRATKRRGLFAQVVEGEVRYFKRFGMEREFSSKLYDREPKDDGDRANEIILFRNYSPWTPLYYGVPRWVPSIPTITEMTAIREFNISFFESGGTNDKWHHVTAEAVEDAKAIADQCAATVKANRGEAHVSVWTSGPVESEVQSVDLSDRSGQGREGHFRNRREDLVKEVLMAHNVPPYRIGWAEIGSLGGSAAREMLRAYRTGSIEPIQGRIEHRLMKTLLGPKGFDLRSAGFRFKFEEIDLEQVELDVERAAEGSRVGALSPNDAREVLGLPRKEIEALDRHYVNGLPITPAEGDQGPPEPGQEPPGAPPAPGEGAGPGQEPGQAQGGDELVQRARRRVAKVGEDREREVQPARAAVERLFAAERRSLAAAVRRSGGGRAAQRAARRALEDGRARWTAWYQETYRNVGTRAAESAFADLEESTAGEAGRATLARCAARHRESRKDGRRRAPVKKQATPRDLWAEEVEEYVNVISGEKIVGIEATTLEQVRASLREGIRREEGADQLARRIDRLYLDEIIPNRPEVIARTEVIQASGAGTRAAAKATGLDLERRWLDSGDDRVREPHRTYAAAERWVQVDEPHVVGGERLMFPGDTSMGASAETTIQCRCAEIFRPRK